MATTRSRRLLVCGFAAMLVATCGFATSTVAAPEDGGAGGAIAFAQTNGTPLRALDQTGAAAVPGELVVRFADGVSAARRSQIRKSEGVAIERGLGDGMQLVSLNRDETVADVADDLEDRSEVLLAEPNFYRSTMSLPDDPGLPELWGLNNTGATVNGTSGFPDADIDAPEAWSISQGSASILVAVVDTGVSYNNPDLAGNIWVNPGESGSGQETDGLDNDSNGRTDDVHGYDFVDDDPNPLDFHGHGSHVAGTIGATGNDGFGITGVNWDVSIMAVRAGDADGSLTTAAIVAAFNYAGDRGARVVNASFGGGPPSVAEQTAITSHPNTLFVVAAGNYAANNDIVPTYPCSYSALNLICVAASDATDQMASLFSNYGPNSVDIAAPGTNVLSSFPSYEDAFSDNFETALPGRWLTGGSPNSWARSSPGASGVFDISDSPASNYVAGTNNWIAKSPPVDLSGQDGCQLEYNLNIETYDDDGLTTHGSNSATAFTSWPSLIGFGNMYSGTSLGTYIAMSDDLSLLDGVSTAYFGFQMTANPDGLVADGLDIDDVNVRCYLTSPPAPRYAYLYGTSMATPHVAGVAALVFAQNPALTGSQVRDRLMSTSDKRSQFYKKVGSYGRLNAWRALDPSVPQDPGAFIPPPTTDPLVVPSLLLSGSPRQAILKKKKIKLYLWCDRACNVSVSASMRIAKPTKRVSLARNKLASVPGNTRQLFTIKISNKTLKSIKRALKKKVRVTVEFDAKPIAATGVAGQERSRKITLIK